MDGAKVEYPLQRRCQRRLLERMRRPCERSGEFVRERVLKLGAVGPVVSQEVTEEVGKVVVVVVGKVGHHLVAGWKRRNEMNRKKILMKIQPNLALIPAASPVEALVSKKKLEKVTRVSSEELRDR